MRKEHKALGTGAGAASVVVDGWHFVDKSNSSRGVTAATMENHCFWVGESFCQGF